MMKSILTASLLFIGFSHSASSEEVEIQRRTHALVLCAKKAITYLDDNISPANVIAGAALAICRKEEQALFTEKIRGKSPAFIEGFKQSYNPERVFTTLVLSDRAIRRSGKK